MENSINLWLNPSLTRFDRVLCKNPIDVSKQILHYYKEHIKYFNRQLMD